MSEGKNRWSLIREFLKKYWWVILIVLIAPLLINFLILQPAFFSFVGEDTDWLGFWGAYIGTVLSSMIAFYVLHKQLEQNHNENEYNRKLQISIFEYQQNSIWLLNLKNKFVEFFKAFSQNDIIMLGDLYAMSSNKRQIIEEIKRIMNLMTINSFHKAVMLPEKLDEKEKGFLRYLSECECEFFALMTDLNVIANLLSINEKVIIETKINEYGKKPPRNPLCSKSRRIWEIINSDPEISLYDMANIRIDEAVKNFTADDLGQHIIRFLDYEQNKIDKELKEFEDNYGTKQ